MAQSVSSLTVHFVTSTKNRTPLLSPGIRERLFPYIAGILRTEGCHLLRGGGVEDHIHLLISLSRTSPAARVAEQVKAGSSRWLKDECGVHDFAWQTGYAVFSVSPGHLESLVAYIDGQEEHHRKVNLQDELRAICKEYDVEIDERYFWG